MNVNGHAYRTIWFDESEQTVKVIDQTQLPYEFSVVKLTDLDAVCQAIIAMQVRGAPLIGATAAYGVAVACRHNPSDSHLNQAKEKLLNTRPTAINLRWAVDHVFSRLSQTPESARADFAFQLAKQLCDNDVQVCKAIGNAGLPLIENHYQKTGNTVNILTHCNAGWLATVDWGTALAPIYNAFNQGIPVHVWVDETRPRNQGAFLTAWELSQHGVPYTVIADNTGGHLMQHGKVDLCIVGTDRAAASGDICNKIGTYLKALAAKDNAIPFYAAVPSSSIDWQIQDGITEIPIEERHHSEVTQMSGLNSDNRLETIKLLPDNTKVANYGFDVTPAPLVTGLITEFGLFDASAEGLNRIKQHCQKNNGFE